MRGSRGRLCPRNNFNHHGGYLAHGETQSRFLDLVFSVTSVYSVVECFLLAAQRPAQRFQRLHDLRGPLRYLVVTQRAFLGLELGVE